MKPCIVNISRIYYDRANSENPHLSPYDRTHAVRNLLLSCEDFDHVVISLTRVRTPWAEFQDIYKDGPLHVISLGYWGLPFGLGLRREMATVARRSLRALKALGIRPDLIHSHTLSWDGLTGDRLARNFGIRHLVSVRGESDLKVIRKLPHIRPTIRRIYREAAVIFFVSAWARQECEGILGIRSMGATLALPNITEGTVFEEKNEKIRRVKATGTKDELRLITVMRLNAWRKKGLDTIVHALTALSDIDLHLTVVGGAKASEDLREIQALISNAGLSTRVTLLGQITQSEVLERMAQSDLFVLVSHNETFGMVYVEALAMGLPIVFGRGTGIDGYVEDGVVGLGVIPGDVKGLCKAVREISENIGRYQNNTIGMSSELNEIFSSSAISSTYARQVWAALTCD